MSRGDARGGGAKRGPGAARGDGATGADRAARGSGAARGDGRGTAPKRRRPRRLIGRLIGGLRVRLVVAFVVVALISAVTATALAYRDARTAVLQRTQQAAVHDLRDQVTAVAADFEIPPDQRSLSRFTAQVADGLVSDSRVVVARYQDLVAVSDSRTDPDARISPNCAPPCTSGKRPGSSG